MPHRPKKFNVWIAYSDLFTNLATFLFISAVGMFAAIGSGLLAPPGWGGATGCEIEESVRSALEFDESLLRRHEPAGASIGEGCAEYYVIQEYRFRSGDLTSFKDQNGARPSEDEFRSRICRPIWRTVANSEFVQSGGRLTFLGIADPQADRIYPAVCGSGQASDPFIEGFPRRRSRIGVITDCNLLGDIAYPSICPRVQRCLRTPEDQRDNWCRDVWAVSQHANQTDAACQRAQAELQAKFVYDQCDRAVDWRYPDHEFEGPEMVEGAHRADRRRELWGSSTDFNSINRDAQRLPPNHPILTARPGSILVEVSYRRSRPTGL